MTLARAAAVLTAEARTDMSTTERTPVADPAAAPTFELEYRYDDADDPEELTVFAPEPDRLATEWITVAEETGVDLDQMR